MATSTPGVTPAIREIVDGVREVVARQGDEAATTQEVEGLVRDVLARALGAREEIVDAARRRPDPSHYVMYPLWVEPDGSFSLAAAVWNVGQTTPIHDHGTWGVVGIAQGVEREERFRLPAAGAAPEPVGEHQLEPGDVVVCCTTDQDIHRVSCASDIPCVGIHVYGADIGVVGRRSYDPETGRTSTFVSRWAEPADVAGDEV